MIKNTYRKTSQNLNAELPGQAAFISSMEKKIGDLLGSKLTGKFRMLVDPNGFHYGFTYGNNGYYNDKALADIDRTLAVDTTTNQLGFSQQPFSVLYEKILKNTGYHLSSSDQEKMNQADMSAQVYTSGLLNAFRVDFPSVLLPSDTSAIAAIFEYITTRFNSIEQIPLYYSGTKNALSDYSANATESFQMHSAISAAQSRLQSVVNNIDKPTSLNGGMQTSPTAFYVGHTLPTFAQTYASLTTESNKIDILLEFSEFDQQSSKLSIDHQAAFLIPMAICVFGRSDTKYTLNTMTTNASSVSMKMSFSGITALAPSPVPANGTASTGWYDEQILSEIVRNTGKGKTGYCLINEEYNVNELFGTDALFSRLKEFIICQAPTITLKMTEINVNAVTECFQNNSQLNVSFFGFAVSSSQHHYTVQNAHIDSQSRSATITLGAPKPSKSVSVETEVAYVLGGVASYPPSTMPKRMERQLSFAHTLPPSMICDEKEDAMLRGELKLYPGSNAQQIYLGNVNSLKHADDILNAVLRIWYYYLPDEQTVWLSDSQDFTPDQTCIKFYREDGYPVKSVSSYTSTDAVITQWLDGLMENIIRNAEEQGLSVVRRRSIPEDMENLCYRHIDGQMKPLKSTYFGIRNILNGNVFANASGTTGDVFIDPTGTVVHKSWIKLWEFCTMLQAVSCTNCQAAANLCGAHVLLEATGSAVPAPGALVDILPLCSSCNHYTKTGQMVAGINTTSLVMIW